MLTQECRGAHAETSGQLSEVGSLLHHGVPGMKFGFSGLVTDALVHQAISLTTNTYPKLTSNA